MGLQIFSSFDWSESFSNMVHIMLAFAIAIPVGWERELHGKSAGLRTFPLVASGACAFMLVGLTSLDSSEANARVFYGIITGIGFIGGGAILKQKQIAEVTGTATAASLWNAGAVGIAVAWDAFGIALLLSVLNVSTLAAMRKFKRTREQNEDSPEKE